MLRKSAVFVAVAAALLIPVGDTSARPHGGHSGGGRTHAHVSSGHFSGARVLHSRGLSTGHAIHSGARRIHSGHVHHGHAHHGHGRHFWHGRWWGYGIGPCWVWSDYYDEFIWQCY